MASPVSIGDIYLVGRLALKLSRAFTKGRKSAPAEFREVENQLYSLSVALGALDRARTEGDAAISINPSLLAGASHSAQAHEGDAVGTMVRSCEETLKHLEAIVQKYSVIGKPRDAEEPLLKRWTRDLRDNWKKIAWTTEGGDLATLRSHLTVHINSMNLVLGVLINSQTTRLEDRVKQVSTMLKEIHEWFVDNLKEATSSTSSTQTEVSVSQKQNLLLPEFNFELYDESDRGPKLICSHASLHPKWNEKPLVGDPGGTRVSEHLFICHCTEPSQNNDVPLHQEKLAAYGLSPLSFPLRLTGKVKSWMLYKTRDKTSNRLVSLIIKNVPLCNLVEFEEIFIHGLATVQASEMLGRGLSTILAHLTPVTNEWRILQLTGDTNNIQKSTETVTFSAGQRSYTRSSIEAIKLLHYKTFKDGSSYSDPVTAFSYLDSAEVTIFYDEQDSEDAGDVSSTTLHLKHSTLTILDKNETTVLLRAIECTGLGADEKTNIISNVDVTFRFTTLAAAEHFYRKVEEMRMELFVISLQFPRKDERTILKLQASQVQSEEIYIPDAEISIVYDASKQRFRLIIVSLNGCSILSQELAEDFLSSLTSPGRRPNFASPMYLIQIEGTGVRRAYQYASGFKYLNFSNAQSNRLFELGLAAIAGRSSALEV